uniref:Uncharacterized protein n=1 Tax=Anguilla anguilla TaxID=7936 RepID=A0A0E9T788_ANGAN
MIIMFFCYIPHAYTGEFFVCGWTFFNKIGVYCSKLTQCGI